VNAVDLDTIDPTFVDDLRASDAARWLVARWIVSNGHTVIVPPIRIRPFAAVRGDYADRFDLLILDNPDRLIDLDAVGVFGVEVKHLSIEFFDAAGFPYPAIIVDTVSAYDRKKPKPFVYVILSASKRRAAIVPCSTFQDWRPDSRFARGRFRDYYFCPLDLVDWYDVPELAS
jgi:hypothetical protein